MTEGKSDLGFFLVPKLASQSPDLRKKSQKNPDIKGKSKRHVTLQFLFWVQKVLSSLLLLLLSTTYFTLT